MFDGVGPIPPDDENEPDPDEITDWTENRSPTVGMQKLRRRCGAVHA
jgi:hypothetical protein